MILLDIKNLYASASSATGSATEILHGVDLTVGAGEVHAIMGPNGAGKSTLSAVLSGKPDYTVTSGSVTFAGEDLLAMSPEQRSWAGLFLSFQYPVEIPGVTYSAFMKAALAARRKAAGQEELSAADFLKLMKEKMAFVGMDPSFAKRAVNAGFSGGEKKRAEIFQMAMLSPVLSILDETDSGLDVDALKTVADGVNAMRSPERSTIIITHYRKLLEYVRPDKVHILKAGRIVRSGGEELADEIENEGFDKF